MVLTFWDLQVGRVLLVNKKAMFYMFRNKKNPGHFERSYLGFTAVKCGKIPTWNAKTPAFQLPKPGYFPMGFPGSNGDDPPSVPRFQVFGVGFFLSLAVKTPCIENGHPALNEGNSYTGYIHPNPYQLRSLLSFSSPKKKNKWEFRPTKVRKNMSTRQKILQYFTNLDLPEIRRYIIYPLLNPPFKAI